MLDKRKFKATRRNFLALMAGSAALATMAQKASADKIKTSAHIVILGAGAAGTAMANRLANRLDGAKITIVDGRKEHWYQPGFTLIATGLRPASYSVTQTADWLPRDVDLVAEYAAEIDPEAKTLTTASGQKITYDYLIVAAGITLDWDKIEGFDLNMVGKEGIAAVYAGPEQAALSFQALTKFTDEGGQALFNRPAGGMKCAGAPLKYAFMTDDIARTKGTRGKMNFTYAAHSQALLGVPIINEKLRLLFADRDIDVVYDHVLKSIDHGKKLATFSEPEWGEIELPYDFINVIPPQRAPDVIVNSPLPWAQFAGNKGWVEVDRYNLRHRRFPEIFAMGDVAGVPRGKTAATVKWMAPVVEDHLVAQIQGKEGTQVFTGYTACPLITKIGRAMLIEFDYTNDLVQSFPGIIAPLEELWISWLMKKIAIKPNYYAMLRGDA